MSRRIMFKRISEFVNLKTNLNHFLSFSSILCTANLVLHRTIERIHVGKQYGDIPRGVFVVRGENVMLLGEIVSNQ